MSGGLWFAALFIALVGGVTLYLLRNVFLHERAQSIAARCEDPEHVLRVASNFKGDRKLVALLHDAIEDDATDADELRQLGFPLAVINAVRHLSRRAGETYHDDYIERLCRAPGISGRMARTVKHADLEDNLRRSTTNGYESLVRRYQRALVRLEHQESDRWDEPGEIDPVLP